MKKTIAIILSILLVMAFALQAAAVSTIAVKGVKLDKSNITLNIGQIYKLKATLTPSNTTQKLLTYVTGNKKIATVDNAGKITGVGPGTTTIVVYTPNKKIFANCSVTVKQPANTLKPVELIWYIRGPGQPADTALVEAEADKQLKNKINATLKLFVIPWGEYMEKMNVIIAANEKFDLCYSASSKGFQELANKGAYADLTELLPKYAPEFMNSMPSYLFDAMKVKGKLMAVPNLQGLSMPTKIAVNGNLFEKYKLPSKITKLDELNPYMEAIKNGEKGVTPFMYYANGANTIYLYYDLAKEQFPVASSAIPGVKVADKAKKAKIINQYESNAFKEYMAWARKAYQNGWFEKSAATQHGDMKDFDAGKYAMFFGGAGPQAESIVYPNFKVYYIDIGSRPFVTTAQITATMTSINYNSPNPERAMMFLNLMNTDVKLYNTLQLGIEGKHYVLTKDGHWDYAPGVTADNTGYNLTSANWEFGNTFNGYPQVGVDAGVFKAQQEYDKKALAEPAIGFAFDSEPVKTEIAQVNSVLEEILVPLAAGSVDPAVYYPQLLEKMKTAGSDRIIAEMQKQLDVFLSYSK